MDYQEIELGLKVATKVSAVVEMLLAKNRSEATG
jgi:hypothetical protein